MMNLWPSSALSFSPFTAPGDHQPLLGIIDLNRSSFAEGSSLAFNILPGLVGAYFLSRKMPIADFFKGILRSPAFADDRDFPNSILAVARAHATTLIALRGRSSSGSRRPVPAATKLIRRTERLVRERRTGTAMQSAEKLQDHIDRDLILECTVTTIFPGNCSVNSRLSLPAHLSSCHSLLRPTLLDRSVHFPYRLRRGRDAVLKKLSIGAAAGASGWTYAVMKAIFLCNGDYSDRTSQPLSAT